jgi:hypothetical protein
VKAPLKLLVTDVGGTGVKILATVRRNGGSVRLARTRLPLGCQMGDNANAFIGGCRLWEDGTK